MFLRILFHILFGALPVAIINYLVTPQATTEDIVMLNLLAFILAIPCNFLAIPFINMIFRFQYKKFLNNYEHRNKLPRYSGSKQFHINLYNFTHEMSALDDFNSYEFSYDDYYNLQAVLIIPLIRMNSNMDIINNVQIEELRRYFNIFPTGFSRNALGKKHFKELKQKVQDKFDKERVTEIVTYNKHKSVDHLSQDLMEKK